MSTDRSLLRHTLATLAYRGGKTIRDANADFATYGAPDAARTPAKILAHIGDLLDWALSIANGKEAWRNSAPLPWDQEVARFFAALEALDTASLWPLQRQSTSQRRLRGCVRMRAGPASSRVEPGLSQPPQGNSMCIRAANLWGLSQRLRHGIFPLF